MRLKLFLVGLLTIEVIALAGMAGGAVSIYRGVGCEVTLEGVDSNESIARLEEKAASETVIIIHPPEPAGWASGYLLSRFDVEAEPRKPAAIVQPCKTVMK